MCLRLRHFLGCRTFSAKAGTRSMDVSVAEDHPKVLPCSSACPCYTQRMRNVQCLSAELEDTKARESISCQVRNPTRRSARLVGLADSW